jgi:hypothetical protein
MQKINGLGITHDAYNNIIILDTVKVSNLILYDVLKAGSPNFFQALSNSQKQNSNNRDATKGTMVLPWCYKGAPEEAHKNGKNVEYTEPLDHTQHHKIYSQELNLKMRCKNPRCVYTASYKNLRIVCTATYVHAEKDAKDRQVDQLTPASPTQMEYKNEKNNKIKNSRTILG